MNMVQCRSVGKIAVESEGARDVPFTDPVNQFLAQDRMVFEPFLAAGTQVLLAETAELQGIVFATGADIVNKDVVVGDLVALLGMVPEPTSVLDQLALVVDERIVEGDDPLVAVARSWVLLQEVEPTLIKQLRVPVGVGEEAVEAGRIGGLGKFPVDGGNILPLGDEQAGEILGEVAALRLIREEVAEGLQRFLNYLRVGNDTG